MKATNHYLNLKCQSEFRLATVCAQFF